MLENYIEQTIYNPVPLNEQYISNLEIGISDPFTSAFYNNIVTYDMAGNFPTEDAKKWNQDRNDGKFLPKNSDKKKKSSLLDQIWEGLTTNNGRIVGGGQKKK